MLRYGQIACLCIGIFVWFHSASICAKPGGERLLESKNLEATLYVSAIHRDSNKNITATFVWFPREFETACFATEFAHCKSLVDCKLVPNFQTCDNYATASNCKDQVRPECKPFKKNYSDKGRESLQPPHQLLESLPPTLPKKITGKIATFFDDKNFVGSKGFPKPTKKYSFKAQVKWERWSNGENFSILDFK